MLAGAHANLDAQGEPHGRKEMCNRFEFDYRLDCLRVRSARCGQLETVTIGFSSFSGFYGPLWLAVEDRLGRKYGLDLKAVYAGRVRPQQLLASGEVPLVIASGSGALTSHVLGVKDQVIVALMSNKVGGGIFSKSEIKKPEDLKGKLIATG